MEFMWLLCLFLSCVNATVEEYDSLVIGSWNIQSFGVKKLANTTIVDEIESVITLYDLLVIAEVRDKSGKVISFLCTIEGYSCQNSSRMGRSNSKEQYVVVYRDELHVQISELVDGSKWERGILYVTIVTYNINIATMHTKPADTLRELWHFENVTLNNHLILGDINADCFYSRNLERLFFFDYMWLAYSDTTVGPSKCAYDRILIPKNLLSRVVDWGISNSTIASDHYPIWVRLRI